MPLQAKPKTTYLQQQKSRDKKGDADTNTWYSGYILYIWDVCIFIHDVYIRMHVYGIWICQYIYLYSNISWNLHPVDKNSRNFANGTLKWTFDDLTNGSLHPVDTWYIYHINWCRISSNRMFQYLGDFHIIAWTFFTNKKVSQVLAQPLTKKPCCSWKYAVLLDIFYMWKYPSWMMLGTIYHPLQRWWMDHFTT